MVEVASEFGTPAYVYAEDDLRARARAYLAAFEAQGADDFEVLFASKAAPFTAAYTPDREEGLSVDVASGGELAMALPRGVRSRSGSTSTATTSPSAELREALEAGVGHVICDSFDEIERLDELARRRARTS